MTIHLLAKGSILAPVAGVQTLVILSALGLLGLSVLWPLVAGAEYFVRLKWIHRRRTLPSLPSSFQILIPAHNESKTLEATLLSVQRSIRHLNDQPPQGGAPECRIRVGADSCTDTTVAVARRFPSVQVTEFPENRSKWLTLKALCLGSEADWLILVDAGTLWPEDLLTTLVRRMMEQPNAIALCPSYKPLQASWIHRILWRMEAWLKRVEVLCGGPVSVHGATVCYQAAPLKRAFRELGNTLWLNDDVAIPLVLRTLYPDGLILYPVGEVLDDGVRQDTSGLKRRTRILLGNLQWAGSLLPYCFRRNPIAGTVALRRLFRVLWAYWVIFMLLAMALTFQEALPALAGLGLSLLLFGSCRELAAAALVSLWTPFRLLHHDRSLLGVWK